MTSQRESSESIMRIALLGASRGLGAALAIHLGEIHAVLLISRKEQPLQALKTKIQNADFMVADFSKLELSGAAVVEALSQFRATHLVYCAGGGPHGHFEDKKWASHEWAFHVNFLFPARLLYDSAKGLLPQLQQFIYVGSAIAEERPEPLGASYGASKRTMKGLIESMQADLPWHSNRGLDLRLYSPGYMDTDLLPPHAWPRQVDGLCLPVNEVAQDLSLWMLDPTAANRNRVFAR